jgi:septal ring factor EnvC (AmiA/AmiB activator)
MMKNALRYRFISFCALIIMLFIFCFVWGQNTKAGLNDEKKKLEKEIKEQKRLLEITKNNKIASLREIELITNQMKQQEQLIRVINDEILSLDHKIEVNTEELNALKQKLDVFVAEYQKAVYTAYKYRNVMNKTGFILSSENLTQAARRINYLNEYSRYLNQQLKTILQTQEEVNQKNILLRQNKAEKTQLFNDRNTKKQNLSKQQQEKNQIVANLKKRESQINSEITKKVNRQKQIDAAIKKIIEEEIAAREKRSTTSTTTKKTTTTTTTTTNTSVSKPVPTNITAEEANFASDFESNKGKLPWPVEKGTIIANFGTYSHPEVSSVMITNNGINILTEKNASILAVFSGVVSRVLDMEGSKVVLIRHGNYITVYSNLTNVTVKQNDKITAKQIIGRVMSSASDADAELHFEIWKDRALLNPSLWLRR